MADVQKLEKLAKLVRYLILKMTTEAGSGHPTPNFKFAEVATDSFSQVGFLKPNPDSRFVPNKGFLEERFHFHQY